MEFLFPNVRAGSFGRQVSIIISSVRRYKLLALDLNLGIAVTVDEPIFIFQTGNTCRFLSFSLDVRPVYFYRSLLTASSIYSLVLVIHLYFSQPVGLLAHFAFLQVLCILYSSVHAEQFMRLNIKTL